MIKVTTTQAHATEWARRRKVMFGHAADSVEALLFHIPPCKHRDGRTVASCAKCIQRQAITDALDAVCDTGGIPRRGVSRNG